MKKETIRISAALFALVLTTAVGAAYSLAHDGSRFDTEKHQAVKNAIDTGDYTAFSEAVGEDAKILENIDEGNFGAFVEAKKLLEAGDMEGAQALFDDLGIKKPFGKGHHFRHMRDSEKYAAIHAAVEAEDYTAFIQAVGENAPFLETITEENFGKFVEMHELKEVGDFEGAQAIADELGFKYHEMHRHHMSDLEQES